MEFRQISAAERADHMHPLQAYAFGPSPWSAEDVETYRRRMRFFESAVTLVADDGGVALAGVAAFPMRQNVRGLVQDMAGVASVASHPSARRRGLVRELLTRLLRQMRDEGCAVAALYPFRPSFYARFGFVGLPRYRTASFAPDGLGHLLRVELPGEVERLSMTDGFTEWDALTRELLPRRHGFAVFDEVRTAEFRDAADWVAIARVGGEVVGAVRYRVDDHGGTLIGTDLLSTGPLGRALLLQFFARHVDQVARVVVWVDVGDAPELWGTDLSVVSEGRVANPTRNAPMARVLDMAALNGSRAQGPAAVTIRIDDDEFIGGIWHLESAGGRLSVAAATGGEQATLTAAGFSGLVYGVLDPVDVFTRGLGEVSVEAVPVLGAMFPRELPYLFSDF